MSTCRIVVNAERTDRVAHPSKQIEPIPAFRADGLEVVGPAGRLLADLIAAPIKEDVPAVTTQAPPSPVLYTLTKGIVGFAPPLVRVKGSLAFNAVIVDVRYLAIGIGRVHTGKAPPSEHVETEFACQALTI